MSLVPPFIDEWIDARMVHNREKQVAAFSLWRRMLHGNTRILFGRNFADCQTRFWWYASEYDVAQLSYVGVPLDCMSQLRALAKYRDSGPRPTSLSFPKSTLRPFAAASGLTHAAITTICITARASRPSSTTWVQERSKLMERCAWLTSALLRTYVIRASRRSSST